MGPASTRKAAPLPPGVGQVVHGPSLLSDQDVYLFREGNQFRLFDKLGAHVLEVDGRRGTHFAVWAPNAKRVSVIGNFNGWDVKAHPLAVRWDGSGIWEGFVPGPTEGELYKYHIESSVRRYKVDKGDPLGYLWEGPPRTASVVWDLGYRWQDGDWMAARGRSAADDAPMSIYEVHLGSWRRVAEEGHRSLSYREMAVQLVDYVREMGFTHVELLPLLEHPFGGSWGYQAIGYFAPTSRFGTPQDLMFLVDSLHRAGIGVILDWVPSHFPYDEHGLGFFDGTHLYEHQDPRKGFHPDWKSAIFNYGRNEVRSFLVSSALFWLERFHFDGLRVDAVASMLYLDYSRKDGEWIPNEYGGRENLEAIAFLKRLNEAVYGAHPDIQTIAEESTAWPMVTRPVYLGGLGFGRKWNMGWMHDTLEYFSKDPVHRKFHQDKLTFNLWYAFTENFILPLSHDEVVHGKGSLIGRMPGDDWQKFANLRLLLGLQFANPGKQLLFMGSEFGQRSEWSHDGSLEWHLLRHEPHAGLQRWVKDLNRLCRTEPALHELDFSPAGFEWVDFGDRDNSVISFLRKGRAAADTLLVVCNMTPVPRPSYRVGAPAAGFWRELLNSDAGVYGGSGQGNLGGLQAGPVPCHGHGHSVTLNLPPLGILFLKAP